MIVVPRIPPAQSGQHLDFQLVNHIIKRTEYAGELLRQYRAIAGDNMFVESHPDGTRISYLQPVGGGGGPLRPLLPSGVVPPTNPTVLDCGGSIGWSKTDYFGFDVCPNVGPPCTGIGSPSCLGQGVNGYIISTAIWPNSCLSSQSAKCSFSASFDDGGTIGSFACAYPGGCNSCSASGTTDATVGYYNSDYFFMYISYSAQNGPQGGPYGFIGSGAFFLI